MAESSDRETRVRPPTESDFVDHPQNLDQATAWRNFGGMALEEAKDRFAENPLCYQEDFMWMGTNAFAFYFPVLDGWLRSVSEDDGPFDDSEAWIIARCIRFQFRDDAIDRLRPLAPAVLDLADYVLANLRRFGDEEDRQRVAEAWNDLVDHVHSFAA